MEHNTPLTETDPTADDVALSERILENLGFAMVDANQHRLMRVASIITAETDRRRTAMGFGAWRCFHCDDVFEDPYSAAAHFGCEPTDQAACKKLDRPAQEILATICGLESELRRHRQEDTPADRLYHSMQSDRNMAVRVAEEEGYAKGLRDGRVYASLGNRLRRLFGMRA